MLESGRWDTARDGPLDEAGLRRKLESLGYRVSSYVYPPGTEFPPHDHAVDKIDAVLSGRFEIGTDEGVLVLGSGEWVMVPAGTRHRARVLGDKEVVSLDAVRY
jgi:quercetin dioxygenase-like cupin family protein